MIIRPPAFAGTLYEPDTQRLLAHVEALLDEPSNREKIPSPKVLVVPHSAYHYSATTAALAYQQLESVYDTVKRVIVLGPSHKLPVDNMALPSADAFSSPLGTIKLDQQVLKRLSDHPLVEVNDAAHANEHSIEVQLPFLQVALDDFELVPFVVGNCDPASVAEVLELLWGDEETLIVISTGFSRNQPYEDVIQRDQQSVDLIAERKPVFQYSQACGYTGLNALLQIADRKALSSKCLGRTTSAAQSGNKDRVRGFAAFGFF